jgi:hypothetical protein
MVLPSRRARSFALACRVGRSAHRGNRIARHYMADHEPVKKITDLGQVLLMVGADSVLVRSSFEAITCSGDTPVIDVKPICWHQACLRHTVHGR